MNQNVEQALESIVQRFKEGDIPEAITYSMFPIPNTPASKWSLFNRALMFLSGTIDAQGFKQWKEAGRYVKKGARSFTILAPRFRTADGDVVKLVKKFLIGKDINTSVHCPGRRGPFLSPLSLPYDLHVFPYPPLSIGLRSGVRREALGENAKNTAQNPFRRNCALGWPNTPKNAN